MKMSYKIVDFSLERHLNEIKMGSFSVLFRKVYSAIKIVTRKGISALGIIITLPIVLLVVFLRPIKLIRFGTMLSQRIGHFAIDVEAYLCDRDQEEAIHKRVDIIGCPKPVCNLQLQTMWDRILSITPGAPLWSILDKSCRFWTREDKHHIKLYDRNTDYRLFMTTEAHLHFTEEEQFRGQKLIEQLCIPPEATWVCLHNRDSAYLDKSLGGRWAYHDYRDFSVQTMVSAAEELTRRGYYIVRMGSVVTEQLISDNTKVIDYASCSHKSDFADIYLLANCAAHIGSDAGIACIPFIFRKPVSYINYPLTMLGTLINGKCYPFPFITKHLLNKEKQCLLSLREMFEAGLYGASESNKFEEAGIEVIANTPEEIRYLAIEVDERLKGQWQLQPIDEKLQNRFWDIFMQYSHQDCIGNIQAPIGTSFLRNNTYLLD